jgi:branched-chain amino acid transport system substrate-binding protein
VTNRRAHSLMSLTLAGALVLTACGGGDDSGSGGSGSGEDLTIGVLLPLTGPLSPLGKEMLNGYEVARKAINDAGGIDGRKVVYEVSDAPTPEAATSVAGTLSADPDVSLIMGSYSSSVAIPASAVASRNRKLYWETGGISAEITGRGLDYIYRTVVSSGMPVYQDAVADFVSDVAAPALGKDASDLRFGLTYTDDAFGTAASEAFTSLAEKNKLNVVAQESYAASASDLSSVVEQLKSADVDVLYAIGGITDAILLVRQSKELGFAPDLIIGNGAGFSDKGFVGGAGDAANGIVVSDAVPLHISDDLLNDDVSPSYSEFTKAFEEEIGYEPLTHATLGFAGAMVLFQNVLPDADPADVDSLTKAADAVDIEPGGTVAGFGVKFDETGQNERAGWYYMQYQDDKLVAVAPDEFAASELLIGE